MDTIFTLLDSYSILYTYSIYHDKHVSYVDNNLLRIVVLTLNQEFGLLDIKQDDNKDFHLMKIEFPTTSVKSINTPNETLQVVKSLTFLLEYDNIVLPTYFHNNLFGLTTSNVDIEPTISSTFKFVKSEVQIVTYEEELLNLETKLYYFKDRWIFKGIGQVQLLKDNYTKKIKVLMRHNDSVCQRIYANHYVSDSIELSVHPNHDNCWIYSTIDSSKPSADKPFLIPNLEHAVEYYCDPSPTMNIFCFKFATTESAKRFFDGIVSAKEFSNEYKNTNT